jgi:hypothetical protein
VREEPYDGHDMWLICANEFSINSYTYSYTFRVVDKNKYIDETYHYASDFPQNFGMVACSDQENAIAYMFFSSSGLDEIPPYEEENGAEKAMRGCVEYYFCMKWE